ncbi:MAG: hypothetical protein RBS88_08325 [Spongiibacteraceae bacterium]|jgi:LPS-assembly lipoprotein|nr:hypothetical protein [Spongiibacteraceae bacterium]
MTLTRLSLISLLVLLVGGCGFHLRNTATVPDHLQPIYVGGDASFGALGQRLRIKLLDDSVQVVRNPAEAAYQLIVSDQYHQARNASIDQRGRVAESALFTGATFELRDSSGRTVWGPLLVEERRTVINNPDNITATNEEIELTREEMLDSLAARILRRAGAYQPDAAATSN